MYQKSTSGTPNYLKLVFCRKDFLGVIAKTKLVSDAFSSFNLDYADLRTKCSMADLQESMLYNAAAYSYRRLDDLIGCGEYPVSPYSTEAYDNSEYRLFSNSILNEDAKKEALAWLIGPYDTSDAKGLLQDLTNPANDCANYDTNLVGELYKLLVKGDTLYVGVESGFVTFLEDVDFRRKFLIDSLELCRVSMQNPALVESPLYKRFISLNL